MMRTLCRKAAIVGVGEARLGKVPDQGPLELAAEASFKAMADAGLRKDQIDGLLTGESMVISGHRFGLILAEYMGLRPTFCNSTPWGGGTAVTMLIHAASAVATGVADVVLVAESESPYSGLSKDGAIRAMAAARHPEYEAPFGAFAPAIMALYAQRHMHLYGTTSEQLAHITVNARRNGTMHPNSQFSEPVTLQDVLGSKPIADPLRMLDCAPISDFGGAFVVTTPERARELKQRPVLVLGVGEGYTHDHSLEFPNLTESGAREAGTRAYAMAGLAANDVDVAQIYDAFTISTLLCLEDLGFCRKGEGGPFVASGAIRLEGTLPMNTHGGLLGRGHDYGIGHVIEAVVQLRGAAGSRQVPGAEVALATGMASMLGGVGVAILGRG